MKLRLRRQDTDRGEWSVVDVVRGYRICRYNHQHHGGTHVHHPENDEPMACVDVETPQTAEWVMRRYHERFEGFDLANLEEVIKEWRSESADA